MLKKGVYRIAGNTSPKVGAETLYAIAEWYPDTPILERNPAKVTWELFRKRNDGKFTSTGIKKVGISSFTFGEKAWRYTYKLEAYLHTPEGKEPMALIINPQQSKVPKINKVELYYVDDAKGNTFSFFEKLVAKAHCVNLANEELIFTLWEDDAKGDGHDPKNLFVASKSAKVKVSNGIATAEFTLTEGFMKKAMRGEHDGQLEFYVTVEYFKNKKHESENVTVNNPLYKKAQEVKHKAPVQEKKPAQHQPKVKGSPAEQKPKSKKEEKGIIDRFKELFDFAESKKATATKDKDPNKKVPNTSKTVTVKDPDNGKENKTCVCKEYGLIWGGHEKMTCEKRKKVVEVCKNIWGENQKIEKANMLMAIMHLETAASFDPSKKGISNGGTKYIGLVQFSATTATSLGTTYDALGKMTFVEQMNYVEKYLKQNKDKMKTLVDFYLQVLKPSDVGKGDQPNHAVFDESISVPDGDGNSTSKEQRNINITREPWVTKYGYSSNATFMVEKDEYTKRRKWVYSRQKYEERYGFHNGKTYVWEIDQILKKKHYTPGEGSKFNKECDNIVEEKKKSNGKYPSWIDVAIAEEKKIIREATHCQYIIDVYEASTDNYKLTKCTGSRSEAAWCATFVNYCLETSGHQSQQDPGAIWYKSVNRVKRNKNGPYETEEIWATKHTTMYMGGIVVWLNNGHTTFVVGIDKSNTNNYLFLGGNQDDGVRFWSMPKTKIHPFCLIPIDYNGELMPLEEIEPSDLSSDAIKYKEGGKTT
ncbi:hypothetical protein [Chryseobacterium sp. MMS23-Vi53]|uniref:hypothetical protein n=1 Tax=Chryseobacterium sp. MMS23-Vi53 TaxID=3386644 RepID=UPI0039E9FC4F